MARRPCVMAGSSGADSPSRVLIQSNVKLKRAGYSAWLEAAIQALLALTAENIRDDEKRDKLTGGILTTPSLT
jgi:hypothetical protein